MNEKRPSPDRLLQKLKAEERPNNRGRLKIYLGAAPGVGKTYTMLEDGINKRKAGVDVVAGVLESHGRAEIEEKLKSLEVLEKQQVLYRDKKLLEFDLDAALQRNPELILMDEMAHTNIPGVRHTKRWQDIKEILDRGIDVYTTLNVQHIESYSDIVSQIVHVPVKETVPDFMIDLADTIEVVDLPPQDLLRRLKEGKVYFPKQAEIASENFFRIGNLIALRELALRATAERVISEALLYRRGEGITTIWPIKEKILVCVGPNEESIRLIRVAKRMATTMQAKWIAVYIEIPRVRLSVTARNLALENLKFAEKLGAETKVLSGFDIVKEIMNFAREQNVTLIMIWRKIQPRWKEIFSSHLADELVRVSGEINVQVVTSSIVEGKEKILSPVKLNNKYREGLPWKIYGLSVLVVLAATAFGFLLKPYLDNVNIMMLYVLGIIIVALFGRIETSLFAIILSVIFYNIFFLPLPLMMVFSNPQYLFTLVIMLLVSYVISHLTILYQRQAESARIGENYTAVINALTQKLVVARGTDRLLENALDYISELFMSQVFALLPDDNGQLKVHTRVRLLERPDEKGIAVAQWVYDFGEIAGLGTETLPLADALYLPLKTSENILGVLALRPVPPKTNFSFEDLRLLETCASQIALALEVNRLEEESKRSELQQSGNQIRTALLQAVSQDLHEPLMWAIKTLKKLMITAELSNQIQTILLCKEIYAALDLLRHFINNILHIAYSDPGRLKLKKVTCPLNELLEETLYSLKNKLGNKPVFLHLESNLPSIDLDKTLIKEVLINLIDNAIKFSAIEAPIDISAELQKNSVIISVADRGVGVLVNEADKLFEKFYRGQSSSSDRGLGLGLAICRNIVKAHGGEIWVENRPEGGAVFRFSLPL